MYVYIYIDLKNTANLYKTKIQENDKNILELKYIHLKMNDLYITISNNRNIINNMEIQNNIMNTKHFNDIVNYELIINSLKQGIYYNNHYFT